MNRRKFMGVVGGSLVAGAVSGWAAVDAATHAAATTAAGASGTLDAAAFHAARRFARTAFGRIAYLDRGDGDVALFLHGFPLNGFQWRGAIERLSPYRRCIAPDFMGLGYTEVADGQGVAPEDQVAMLVALLDQLSIASVDIIANDSGGQAAQIFVARHPERVRTLLLSNCDTEINSPPAAMAPVIALSKQGKWLDQWIAPWHADHALARSPEGFWGMCYLDPANPTDEAIDTYFPPLLATPRRKALAHAYAVALERNPLVGIAPALKRSTMPTRIVWGMGDTIFAPGDAEHLDRAFGNSRGVRRLEGSKLFWPEERPDVIAEEARRLWEAG
ncbi:pimeloyl-ACP methyl ester carboxylesterase [Luteimonas cucumeris]|uniref:Pimeloyl-ACP methyl ester carboxylesterase n=1 Tax=Luteimonas cucumeris TaxID=985012 RepID=A0A562L1Y7_9GAMM|nr:alpha/beta hydrolase [Luteimonas cucumeris]TWI01638.1 pimeloyl-ACP methyl ester carboxylesterase [Luteimonas cucumeris]